MPKRKRLEDELEEKLAYHRKELFRMLKVAKGFERQRMAKRQRDPKSTPDKRDRIDKEIVVLKVRFIYPGIAIAIVPLLICRSPSISSLSPTPTSAPRY